MSHAPNCPAARCAEGPYHSVYSLRGTGLFRTCKTHPNGQWMPDFDCCNRFDPDRCTCAVAQKEAA